MHQPELAGRLVSIQVGLPTDQGVGSAEGVWRTGFFKLPMHGPVSVTETNLAGDGQADLKHHGGPDKAVLAYAADHYDDWKRELGISVIPYGGFGENLSIAEIDESDVCIGDVWQIDRVLLQVSQPRQPCWKLGRRWNQVQLPKLVVQSRRTGWYFRVLQTGTIEAGSNMVLVERPRPMWSIVRANEVFYDGSREDKDELEDIRELSRAWKKHLRS